MDSKKCVSCGKEFFRKDQKLSLARFEKKQTCSRECLNEYNSLAVGKERLDPKTGKPFQPRSSFRTVDGVKYYFYRYNKGRIVKTGPNRGYFKEDWLKADVIEKQLEAARERKKRYK